MKDQSVSCQDASSQEGSGSGMAHIKLTQSQQKGLDLAVSSDSNLMISGIAGSGKSVLTNTIIETGQKMGKNVLTCASTGVAAMNPGRHDNPCSRQDSRLNPALWTRVQEKN